MNKMLPFLVLFGLLLWYISSPSKSSLDEPKISRLIKSKNIQEFET